MADNNTFDLEHQYQLYLERVELKESEMHSVQRKETKQAFIGACGQMLILLRDDVAALDDDKAMEVLESMMNQVGNFFLKETNKMN